SRLAGAAACRALLQDLYRDGTLLFIGFRHGDPDLSMLLDRIFAGFEPPQGEHFFAGAGLGPVDSAELRAEHHMTVLPLEAMQGDRAVDSLAGFLGHLVVACEKASISLHSTRPAPDDLDAWCARLKEDPGDEEAREAIATMERAARDGNHSE